MKIEINYNENTGYVIIIDGAEVAIVECMSDVTEVLAQYK